MSESIAVVRAAYPQLDYCFSFISEFDKRQDVSFLDLLELHVFMPLWSDFDEQAGYHYELFEPSGYEHMVRNAEALYRSRPEHWKKALNTGIEAAAEWSRHAEKPLITTEGWGVINYKDWPLLDWGWVKELCEHGVRQAAASGRWVAMATSHVLRSAVRRHVARRGLAPSFDPRHPSRTDTRNELRPVPPGSPSRRPRHPSRGPWPAGRQPDRLARDQGCCRGVRLWSVRST